MRIRTIYVGDGAVPGEWTIIDARRSGSESDWTSTVWDLFVKNPQLSLMKFTNDGGMSIAERLSEITFEDSGESDDATETNIVDIGTVVGVVLARLDECEKFQQSLAKDIRMQADQSLESLKRVAVIEEEITNAVLLNSGSVDEQRSSGMGFPHVVSLPVALPKASITPRWVMLVRTDDGGEGHGVIAPVHLRSALEYFEIYYVAINTNIVMDYNHASVGIAREGKSAPAAGWITDMELRADGTQLWGHVIWTAEAARTMARQQELHYVSPVFRINALDRITGEPVLMHIHSVGLLSGPDKPATCPDWMTPEIAVLSEEVQNGIRIAWESATYGRRTFFVERARGGAGKDAMAVVEDYVRAEDVVATCRVNGLITLGPVSKG